ncbi:hypothetical protein MKX47_02905 [Solibacillus sp. FSL R7-0668]|uniref:hypothetical protein n=1 Tax=Solibacillus sp. FSL R7-0668 TaxID=2921688 RepID=UPI0030FB3178
MLMHLGLLTAQIDLEKPVREGLKPNQINDDTSDRHRHCLYEAVSSFLVWTYQVEKIPLRFFHGDKTSKSV